MKAVTFYQPGGPEVLRFEEIPAPVPGSGQALVRVHACSLNHLDLIVRERGPAASLPWPHITGADAAGAVAALGPDVSDIEAGTSVVINPGLSCGGNLSRIRRSVWQGGVRSVKSCHILKGGEAGIGALPNADDCQHEDEE